MIMFCKLGLYSVLAVLVIQQAYAYSARNDAQIIAEYLQNQRFRNHAKVTRTLVHQTDWSAVGSISTNAAIPGFPMVNTVSIDDSTADGNSTGKIHFLLTDLDFTGKDWRASNKVTFFFSDEQNLNCKSKHIDPMEPTCARAIISGKVIEMDKNTPEYEDARVAFVKRHPATGEWMKHHNFYLCELDIEHIFELDYYGGANEVTPKDYYAVKMDNMI